MKGEPPRLAPPRHRGRDNGCGNTLKEINTSASDFEELAVSLATLNSYLQQGGGVDAVSRPLEDFSLLYRDAVREPLSYLGVTELTGQSLSTGDRRSGRGAWLLANIEQLQVYGVHSLLWHQVKGQFSAPLIDQVAQVLGKTSRLTNADIQELGHDSRQVKRKRVPAGGEASLMDVLGVRRDEVWLVQTLTAAKPASAAGPAEGLFDTSSRVFAGPVLEGQALFTLYTARDVIQRAFPTTPVRTFALALTLNTPDFELHRLELGDDCPARVELREEFIEASSAQPEFRERITDDRESLWTLTRRRDDDLFRGLPPCRGGRTLGMLALMAKDQLRATGSSCGKRANSASGSGVT